MAIFLYLIAIGCIVGMFLQFRNLVKYYFIYRSSFKGEITPYQEKVIRVVLNKYVPYFQKLSQQGKRKFIKRLAGIYFSFEFVGRGNVLINTEVKTLICSAIVKLTFGLKEYDLDRFKTIIVYPNIFQITDYLPRMKGATSESGKMYFSLDHIMLGYETSNDGINLAIHEMAHAIKLNYFNNIYDRNFGKYKDWETEAEITQIEKGNDSIFFRKYAYKNMHEYFAVTMENFIERPKEFLENYPRLFAATCLLLNQNPLNTKSDYKISNW